MAKNDRSRASKKSADTPTQRNSTPVIKQLTNQHSETGDMQTMIYGLRAIVCSELINGPFLLFPWVKNELLTTVGLYNEYFSVNKIYHIDVGSMKAAFIKEKHSLLMVLMNHSVYDSVINGYEDISESLNSGDTHVMEFECVNGENYMLLLEQLRTLSLYSKDNKVVSASTKADTYERLYPEVFYAWKEDAKEFFSDIKNLMTINKMHLILVENHTSVVRSETLFSYPIKSCSDIKINTILNGLIHIHSIQDRLMSEEDAAERGITVPGSTIERLVSGRMVDDRLLYFWFKWCVCQLLSSDCQRSRIAFFDSILTSDENRFANPGKNINKVFQARILLLPIHHKYHWSLAVVENPYNLVQGEGYLPRKETPIEKKETPIEKSSHVLPSRILHYDSMMHCGYHKKSHVSHVVGTLLKIAAKQNGHLLHKLPEVETGLDCNGIQTEGSNDCGLFVCKFIEHVVLKNFVDGVGICTFSQTDCSEFRGEVTTLLVRLSCNATKTRDKSV